MQEIVTRSRATAGDVNLDHGIRDIEVLSGPDGFAVYASSGSYGGMTGYRLNGQGALSQIDTVTYTQGAGAGLATEITLVETAAGTRMYVGGTGAGRMLSYDVDDTGQIGGGQTLGGIDAGIGVLGTAVQAADGTIVLANPWDKGFRCFAENGSTLNQVISVSNQADSYGLGLRDAVTVSVGGSEFLITAAQGRTWNNWSPDDAGLTSYALAGNGAALADSLGTQDGLGFMVPTDMTTVTADGVTYVVLCSAQGDSGALSVIRVNADGGLHMVDHVGDTRDTRFAAAQAVAALEVDGRAYVVAGGGDDGLSLFTVAPGGHLVLLDSIADNASTGLSGITALELAASGDDLHIFAASQSDAGLSHLTFDLSDVGQTRATASGGGATQGGALDDVLAGRGGNDNINGNGGDDILIDGGGQDTLRGGSGRDIFVMQADDTADRIADFDVNNDRIDLSGWAFFKDADALSLSRVSGGVQISWHEEDLTVISADTQTLLDFDALRGAVMDAPTRVFEAPEVRLSGGSGADVLQGQWAADVLKGGAGDDTLRGGAGDDLLVGGSGNDRLEGGTGFDTADMQLSQRKVSAVRDLGGDRVEVTSTHGVDVYIGVEQFNFTDGNLNIREVISLQWGYTLKGGNAAENIVGGSGHDTITGAGGDDTLSGGRGNDVLVGGAGDDVIDGGKGTDTAVLHMSMDDALIYSIFGGSLRVQGTAGTDTYTGVERFRFSDGTLTAAQMVENETGRVVTGTDGQDTLYGGGGHDTIDGGGHHDRIDGGAGNDVIIGGHGTDTAVLWVKSGGIDLTRQSGGWIEIRSAAGTDRFHGIETFEFKDGVFSANELISAHTPGIRENGSDRSERMKGDMGSDRLKGLGGNDSLSGSWGDDTLIGGDGSDNLSGGQGRDVLYGGTGRDFVRGGTEADQIKGEDGYDTLKGEDGNDRLEGGRGNDKLEGGDGNDRLLGGGEKDKLIAGDGNDVLYGQWGDDLLYGGRGYDLLSGGAGNDRLAGGKDKDRLYGDDGHDYLDGGTGDDLLRGGDGYDKLIGDNGNDRLEGGAGNDKLYGGGQNDLLFGGDQKDKLFAGDGNDMASGDAGKDVLDGGRGDDTLKGGAGNDRLLGGKNDDWLSGGDGHDYLDGSSGNDVLRGDDGYDRLSGGVGADRLEGGRGRDTLEAGSQDDLLFGGRDDDRLFAGEGADVLAGEHGNDWLDGGKGNDQLKGGDDADRLYGGKGDDYLYGGSGDDYLEGGQGADRLKGEHGNDRLLGDIGRDKLEGGAGRDTLDGGGDGDWLYGGDSNDLLAGREGDDVLDGGGGNDRLEGGAGDDRLTGGGGADTFVFEMGGGQERITDFDLTYDTLRLESALTGGSGDLGAYAQVVDGTLVLDFGDGQIVTLDGVSDLAGLEENTELF